MDNNKPAVETETPAAAPEQPTTPVVTSTEDYEAKIAQLEADKVKAIEEGANWKVAALKAKGKLPTESLDEDDETQDEKMRRIAREELAQTKVSAIDKEKEDLLVKLAKENKELKLANMNKTTVPASMGTHSESIPVTDTLVTPEQLSAFKARGWSDKDIETYKKNLRKYGGR